MKILRLIPVLDFGGVETTFLLEAESIDRATFDFNVCTFWKMGRMAERIKATGTPVISLETDPSIRDPRATIALARLLRRLRPDILHASIGEANFHAALVGRACGVPVTIIEEQGLPDRNLLGRAVHGLLYRRVEAIIGVSKSSCTYMMQREWAPEERVHLLYNAASQSFFDTPVVRREPRSTFEFLTVGRLVDVKNHQRLLHAFRLVAGRTDKARLTIIGDGPLRPVLDGLVRELDLADKVSLPGFRSDIQAALDASDCFLLPSLSEGFGIAAVEAMARGVPPIVSDTGALAEVTAGLGSEWVVPATDIDGWAEAMTRMATLPADRIDAMRAASRQAAERFSQGRHVNTLQSLYAQLYATAVRPARASARSRDHSEVRIDA